MALEQMITQNSQLGALRELDQMIAQKRGSLTDLEQMIAGSDLKAQVKCFLLSCKVDELSPATLRDYNQKLRSLLNFCSQVGAAAPKDVTTNHIRLFLLQLQETCKPVSVSDYYRAVKRFFNWMVDEGQLEKSPMANIRPPRVPKELIIPFKQEHIKDLLLLCDENTFLGARNRAIILVFMDTAVRLSELANMQIKEIDIDSETIKIFGKGAKERVVRIGKRTQKALLRYLLMRDDDLPCLWVNQEGQPFTAWGIGQMIKKLGKRAEITGVRCSAHTFRHYSATQSFRNGARDREVQSLLGHSTPAMTQRYLATVNSEDAVIAHRRFSPVDNLKGLK